MPWQSSPEHGEWCGYRSGYGGNGGNGGGKYGGNWALTTTKNNARHKTINLIVEDILVTEWFVFVDHFIE